MLLTLLWCSIRYFFFFFLLLDLLFFFFFFFFLRIIKLVCLGSRFRDRFISKGVTSARVTRSLQLNAAVDIDTVGLADTGYYGVQVSVQAKDHQGNPVKHEFKAAALLTVGGLV